MLEGVRLSPTTAPTTRVVGGIHPSSATEAAAFVVDGMATCVTGRVELVLDGVGGGLQLDQVCITVSIHGEIKTVSRAHPDTATHKVIGPASRTVIFNSATQGPLSLRKPPFTLPFQVPLNALDLPPAFPIITDPVNSAFAFTDVNQLSPAGKGPDASASIKYSIKASVSYMQDGEEIIKDIEVPLVILPPEAKRAFLLATQSSFSLSNVDTNDEHSIPHEGINYLWTIAKRAVVQGDTFCMEINSSSPYTLEHTVKISLRARLTIRSPNGNVQTSSKNLATVCEPLIPAALHSKLSKLHLENVEAPRECTTRLMLHVPPDIVASMDTTAFTYTHFLRLELMHEGEVVALVDVPAAVVQRGTGQAGQLGLPRLARIESRAWQDVPKNELEDSMSSLYVARWGYVPDADGWEDEISLEVGDELLVSYVFSDGMVYVENLTQRCKGLVPMHHLIEAAFLEQKLTEQIQKTNATDPIAIPVHVVSSPTPSITRGTNLDNRPAEPDDNTMNGTISQSSPSLVLGPQSPTIIGSSPLMTGSSGSGLSPSQSGNSRVSPIPPLTPAALSFNSSIPEISVATTEVLSSELPPSYDEIADTVEPIASTPTAPSHLISAHQSTLTTGSSTLASRIDRNASSSTRFFARFRQTNNTVVNVPAVVPRVIDGVVSVESAEAHLGLLHRFAALENKIDRMSDWRFLCRAEQRYLIWLDYLREEQPDPSSLPLPPLDVAMMWHSHMLNPLRFLEDCFFIFGSTPPHNFPLARMYALPPNEYNPQDGSREVWESWTHGEPFEINPLDPPRPFNFLCSWCKEMFEVEPDLFVEYRMKDGKVFCGACGACSTAESVSVKRFLADVDQLHSNKRVLMGTALDDKGCVDVWTARKDLEIVIPPSGHFLLMAHDSSLCSWVMMESILKPHLQSLYKSGALKQFAVRKATFPRMFKAYKHIPIPLSLDLVGAVLRQREFTTKMVSGIIDWGQRDSLPRATLRYRDFLNLMAKQRKAFLVPTLDIDLMWHTHQLHPLKYQTFGLLEVGYVINHDDAVEADTLNKSFAQTNLLWKNCYNEPYAAQREESSWFRRPIEAQKKPIGRVVPVNTVPDGRLRGACVLHDPSARTSYARRSNKKYPISKEPGYAVLVIGGAVTATGACSSCVAACAHWRKYGFEFHPAGPGSHIFGSDFWGGCGGGATFSCGGGSASVTPASRGGFDSSSFSTLRPTHGHHTSLGSTNAGISNSSFDAGSGAAHSHSHHSGHSHSHHSGPSHSHHSGLSHSHHSGHSHSHHSGLSHSHHSAHGGGGHH